MRNTARWEPLVEQDAPVEALEFVLTPRERDQAAIAKLHLEAHRRRLNQQDTVQAAVYALARLDS